MPPEEGLALYAAASSVTGPLLEIGTYCGKSSIYLGAAAREMGTVLYTIDHHRGSEEMQSDWDHHDADVVDPGTGRMDSLPHFRRTIEGAGLEDVVIAIIGDSPVVAANWTTPIGFLFIVGPQLRPDGVLAIHDVFENPADGGQGPFRVYERARSEGFDDLSTTGSLRVLRSPARAT